jgi:hypothetical protein
MAVVNLTTDLIFTSGSISKYKCVYVPFAGLVIAPLVKAAVSLRTILTGEPVILVDVKMKLHAEIELAADTVGALGFDVHNASL